MGALMPYDLIVGVFVYLPSGCWRTQAAFFLFWILAYPWLCFALNLNY